MPATYIFALMIFAVNRPLMHRVMRLCRCADRWRVVNAGCFMQDG